VCMGDHDTLHILLRWGTGVSGNFSANCSCPKSVHLLPSQKMYSTRKTRSSIERTIVSRNWFQHLNTLPVLHFNRFNGWIQWNVTQQQHTSTAISILTTKSTYRSLSAQWLSECTVLAYQQDALFFLNLSQ